ncbi:MAG: alpha/beta hydrolase family protein [Bacteroidales bacterium]|nr:alpha/beta hydrolase family protein [Bacteroidales bacterium]
MKNSPQYFTAIFCLFVLAGTIGATYAAQVDTVRVYSAAMDRELPAAVVLPQCYGDHDNNYPVIYLLHGASGSFSNWLVLPPEDNLVKRLADQYRIIFVLPEGGRFSFYFDSPVNEKSQYETHITNELIPFIDETYRTAGVREARAVTGLSMGGHGALYLAARNPHLFAAAGSMSGAVDLDVGSWDLDPELAGRFFERFADIVGVGEEGIVFLEKHSVVNMTSLMKENRIPLIIDCGIDDFLLDANRKLYRRLLEEGIAHDYIERPGVHDWNYWGNALLYQVLFISEVFRAVQKE